MTNQLKSLLAHANAFAPRHLSPTAAEVASMLETIGVPDLDGLVDESIPSHIRMEGRLRLPDALSEREVIDHMRSLAGQNTVLRSLIGMGYSDCITPPVILRNVLENPGWYTQYTPYQAEISQGRLEALINFQTMVADLTGLPLANASLLDEGTAAAEAMAVCRAVTRGKRGAFFVANHCHPQTIEVIETRAEPLGIEVQIGDPRNADWSSEKYFGVLLQYPDTYGSVDDWRDLITDAKSHGTLVVMATDLLALTQLTSPGTLGADIAIGNSQRFGVPYGLGGPMQPLCLRTTSIDA